MGPGRWRGLALAVLAVWTATVSACSGGDATGSSEILSYRVSGQVVDEVTSAPIQDVLITVLRSSTRDTLRGNVRTDANGRYLATFQLAGHEAGSGGTVQVALVAQKDGYELWEEVHLLVAAVEGVHDAVLRPTSSPRSSEERMAALDDVESVIAALPGDDFEADTEALVAYLRSRPEFAAAGASDDGTVFAVFTDGTLAFVIHGGPVENAQNTPGLLQSMSRTLATSASAPPGATVPSTNQYRLLNAMGSYFASSDSRAQIATMLSARGYSGIVADATLENLRSVAGDGVFYLRAHGGSAFRQIGLDEDFYALWTSSPAADPEVERADASLQSDLLNKRVAYMLFRNSRWNQAIGALPENRHYGITHRFVAHYMSFADDSLIYIDACDGAVWPFFRAAFVNASVFAGWNERAGFEAIGRTASFVFDRLLGTNQFAPETPAQRPFDYEMLATDPRFGSGQTYGYSKWIAKDGGTIEAILGFHRIAREFGMLAPSIRRMEVDEGLDRLTLWGLFGNDPGAGRREVIVGGTPVTVKTWGPDEIQVEPFPVGLAGEVVVRLRGRESNLPPITEWRGPFSYTVDVSVYGDLPANTLRQEISCPNVRIRVDLHEYRDSIGRGPQLHPEAIPVGAARDLQCTWEFQGTGTDAGGQVYTLSGAGSFTWQNPVEDVQDNTMQLDGTVDPRAAELRLARFLSSGGEGTLTVTLPGAGSSETQLSVLPISFPTPVIVRLDQDFNIQAGSSAGVIGIAPLEFPFTVRWGAITATHGPRQGTYAR